MKDKTVLVIEDDAALRKAISAKLRNKNFSVVSSDNVPGSLSVLEQQYVDAIWLDHYLLGSENGVDFIAKVKSDESKWKAIPVFVVSNSSSEESKQSYVRFGVKNYFVKSDHSLAEIVDTVSSELETEHE